MKAGERRIVLLDELRGFALVCMVIHHSFYDINYVFGAHWAGVVFDKLCVFQPIIWAVFIIVSGICCSLSRSPIKRGIIVFVCGAAVTFVTAFIMPKIGLDGAEIYYGILTFMGISMILAGILKPIVKKIPIIIGIMLCVLFYLMTYKIGDENLIFGLISFKTPQNDALAVLGIHSNSFYSADYFPLLPWVFIYFVGVNFGRIKNKFPEFTYRMRVKPLAFIGRQSLWVYILHQPVLFGLMFLIKLIFKL